ncbi:unnamed protein product [Allacma fusca]|uniref:Uncharacterized protein n=1 Tax=Allacma fusca TaxID=39272 RepID=A0A8J2KUF9_9HEXA|nr:unnamed protein product [Allacma fusca]
MQLRGICLERKTNQNQWELWVFNSQGGIIDFATGATAIVTKGLDSGASLMITKMVDAAMDIAPTAMRKLGAGSIPINSTTIPLIPPLLGMNLSFVMYDITLNGLDSLHRVGPANVQSDIKNRSALVTFDGEVNNLRLNASMKLATHQKTGTPLKISGNLGYGDAKVVLRLITRRSSRHAELVSFELKDIGNITLQVEGLGPTLNNGAQNLAGFVTQVFKEQIRLVAEIILTKEISKALKERAVPVASAEG